MDDLISRKAGRMRLIDMEKVLDASGNELIVRRKGE